MTSLIFQAFYLALPAYFANMAPVIFAKLGLLKWLARPIDGGQKLGRDYIFGLGKTWRGIISAVILGIIISGLQAWLFSFDFFRSVSVVDYPRIWPVFGFLAGLGAILGDLFKSFLKRRIGISSGGPWPIFDQLDFVVGFFVFVYLLVRPDWQIVLAVFVLTLVLHPLTNLIAYILRIKKVWW